MSTTIDERVVEMRFDNKHFESNVATSMSTLEKLKQKLNLSGASKGLENLNAASNKVDFSKLENTATHAGFQIQDIWLKTASVFEYQVARRIVNAGKNIASALTIDPITTGFKEYETQINSVQTILANTQSKGTTIDDVTAALDELNKYADMTIYNFTEMTRNIGTFTAAGIDLDTSVNAIQGIANLAAVSGSTSQQASTAMYQLSQALSTGTVRLMDWNSVVNAGMGGEVFQNALKETSRLLETGVDAAIEAKGSFRESLSEGWLTAEVLTETLKKFTTSGAAEYLAKFTGESQETVDAILEETDAWGDEADAIDKAAETLAKKSGKNKDEIKSALQMAKTATEAATKVKTFSQLWDVMKEAAQSGWAKTWQIIIGDFEEAKSLLTPLSDFFTGVINKMSDWRNNLLESALGKGFRNLADTINGVLEPASKAAETVSKVTDSVSDLGDIVNKVIRGDFGNGQERFNALTEAGENYYRIQNKVNETLGNSYRYSEDQITAQDKLIGKQGELAATTTESQEATVELTDAQKDNLKTLVHLSNAALKSKGYTDEQIAALNELKNTAKQLGMPIDEFIDKLDEINGRWLLINSFKNIGKSLIAVFTSIGKAWQGIFDPIQADSIFDAIAAFHKFTASLIPNEEASKNLTRTFKGLFAVLDIVTTILGGGLKIAFNILSQILNYFDLDILDVTAAIGDALVKFHEWFESVSDISDVLDAVVPIIQKAVGAIRNWFNAFKSSEGLQNTINYIKEIASSIKDWWDSLKDSEDLPKTLAEGIVNAFSSIPKIISTICSNLWSAITGSFSGFDSSPLGGFIDNITSGLSIAGQTVVELGKILLDKINGFLTAHGFEEISADAIAGLVNGLRDGATNAWNAAVEMAKSLVEKVKAFLGIHSPSTVFAAIGGFIIAGLVMGLQNGIPDSLGAIKDVFQPMLDWIQGLDFGSIIAAVLGVGTIGTTYKVVGILENLTSPLEGLSEVFEGAGKVLKKSAGPIAKVIKNTAKVVKSFSKVLNAVAFDIKAEGIKKLGETLLMLVAAIAILTLLDPAELWNAVGLVAALAAILVGLSLAVSKMNQSSASIGKDGLKIANLSSGLLGIGAAILLMTVAAKLLGEMDTNELIQGGLAIAAFSGIIVGLMAATKLISGSKNVDSIGGTLLKIAAAIGVMALVAKLLGGMDTNELIQGGLAITYFGGIIVGLMAATKLISGSKNVGKIGPTLLAISGAIATMALVAFMLSMVSWEDFAKGTIMITAFGGIIVGLMAATKLISGSKNVGEIGNTLLAISGAIAILAGIAVLLGLVPTENLIKGVVVVAILSTVMAGLIAVTKLANNCLGTIIALTAMIVVLAGAVYLISKIDGESAITSAAAIGGLMLVMTGVLAVLSQIGTKAVKALVGVVALAALGLVLREFVWVLSSMDGLQNAQTNAIALSLLAGACTVMIAILSLIGIGAITALAGVVALAALGLVLREFVWVLASMESLENARANAETLTLLAGACTVMLAVLTLIGFACVAALAGVIGLAALGLVMREFVWVLASMEGLENAKSNSELLIHLMTVMANVLVQIGLLGPLAIVGEAAVAGLVALIGVIGVLAVAIGALMEKFPSIQQFLDTGLPVLEQLAGSIGTMIGNLVGGILTGIGDAILSLLPKLGLALSTFMIGAQPFITLASSVDSSVIAGAGYLTAAILLLTAADFIAGITQFLNGGISFADLGAQLMAFGVSAVTVFNQIKNVDENAVTAAGNVADMILKLTASNLISTITEKFGGSADFSTMGANLIAFGEAVVGFSDTISGKIDTAAVEAATNAGLLLVELNKSLPRSGGWIQDIIGEQDFGKFAESCKAFATAILDINEIVSQEGFEIQEEKLGQLVAAGTSFSELNKSLPRTDGWLQDVIGEKDLNKFGKSVKAFAGCIIDLNGTLSDEALVIQEDKLTQLSTAGTKFSDLNNSLPKSDGWLQDVVGKQDLTKFGTAVKNFATCIIGVNEALNQEGFSVNLDGMEQLKQAGIKMNDLQSSLPKSDGWWQEIAGSQDIGDFGDSVKKFAGAIVEFSTKSTEIDQTGVSTCISTANRIKNFLTSLKGLDYDGVDEFTGIGTGSVGADGPAYDVACAIAKFSEKVADIDTEAVTVSVRAARNLKTLIAGLVGLDTSGIENFKPGTIGDQMKTYSDKVAGIDTEKVSSSISTANRLKNFIAGLVDLDTSGVGKFNPGKIGTALATYSTKISDFNSSNVSSSISAANRLKNFISSLVDLDTTGIGSFKTAVNELATVNMTELVEAFSGASEALSESGADIINGLISGMKSKLSILKTTVNSINTTMDQAVRSKLSLFTKSGQMITSNLARGISSKRSAVVTATTSCVSGAASILRSYYTSFYSAGSYLVSGFCDGITANTYRAAAKAAAMANAAESAARQALDINSPSKVFREIGSGIPEGFALGIGMLGGEVKRSVVGMASTAVNTTRSAMTTVLDALNADMDTQPTIRPVIDLSDVQNGANAIHGMFNGTQTIGVRSNLNAINATMNAKLQNGTNDDIISAINKLNAGLENNRGDVYNFGNFTYDDGSNISDAVQTLVRAARIGRRV